MGNGSFVTLVPPDSLSDVTIVVEKVAGACKCTPAGVGPVEDGVVVFQVTGGLPGAGTVLQVWRTNETVQFWRDSDVEIASDGTLSVFVARDSLVTLSTRTGAAHGGVPLAQIPPPSSFPLPYSDDFSNYAEGSTPVRFWADQTGSFAVHAGALTQVVPIDPGPNKWAAEDVDPITLLGDGTLQNVTVSIGASFSPPMNTSGQCGFGCVYVQLCARITAYTGFKVQNPPGLCLALNSTGAWVARAGPVVLGSGVVSEKEEAEFFDPTALHSLVLTVRGERVIGWVGVGHPPPGGGVPDSIPCLNVTSSAYTSGLVGLGSGYHWAAFTNFSLSLAV